MNPNPSDRSPVAVAPNLSRPVVLAILAGILLLAAGLRAVHLTTFGLGVDEDMTVQTSLSLPDAGWDITRVQSEDIQGHFRQMPVVYYLEALSLKLAGFSELGFRLPPYLLGLLSVLLLFGLARAVAGTPTALWAAAFLALSATQIQYAQTARYVGPSTTATLALGWGIVAFLRRPTLPRGIGVLALLALAAATNLFLLLIVPLLWLFLALGWRSPAALGWERPPRWIGRTVVVTAAFAVLVLALSAPFVRDWLAQSVRFYNRHAGLRASQTARAAAGMILRLEIPVVVLGLAGAVVLVRERRAEGWLIALLALGPELLLLALSPFFYAPARYVVFTAPFWCLLAARFVVFVGDRGSLLARLSEAAVGGTVAAALFFSTTVYLRDGDGRDAMKNAFLYVAEHAQKEDIVASTFHTDLPVRLYHLPMPVGNHVQLFREWGNWLGKFPDRRAWVVVHTSFDPSFQKMALTEPDRCRQEGLLSAATRFTVQWVTIYRCEPRAAP